MTLLLAALLGFALADLVMLMFRVPSLLQPGHLSGLLALMLSALILYIGAGLLLLGFWLMLWLMTRLLRLRFSGRALAVLTIVFAPLFLVVQERLQERILGMYISLKSPLFYVPTAITIVLTVVALVLVSWLAARVGPLPGWLRKAFAWPSLIGTAFIAFVLLSLGLQPRMNALGVFSEEEQRAQAAQRAPTGQATAPDGAPNFIVLMIEATRFDQFTPENAPFLWQLAGQNVHFPRYYSVAPATRPSVTSFFTSLYPAQHGCYNLALSRSGGKSGGKSPATIKVSDTIVSLPRLLQDHGYRTVQITSNNLAADPAFGFEDVFSRFDATEPYRFQVPAPEAFVGFQFLKGTLRLWRIFKIIVFSPEHSLTYFDAPRVNRTVMREMSRQDDRPYFLYVHYMEPHSPYYYHPYRPLQINAYSPAMRDKIVTAYQQEIGAVDAAIAELWEYLQSEGLLDNTYVLITADHGEEFYDHRNWGHGKSVYPEVIGVPAVMVAPGLSSPQRVEKVVESIDVAPTFAELAAVPLPDFWEGRSLAPYLRPGSEASQPPEQSETPGVESPEVAFNQFHDGFTFWASAVTEQRQVVFRSRGDKRLIMLYDLTVDPLAQKNLYGEGLAAEETLVRLLDDNLTRLEATAELFRGDEQEIDPQHLEQLRALGYVD